MTAIGDLQAISCWIDDRTGWSIKKFIRTARRIEIQASAHTITAADPLPNDLCNALEAITQASQRAALI